MIRSRRKTLSVEIKPDGRIIVRAPMRYPKREIERFLLEKSEWIRAHRARILKRQEQQEAYPIPALTDAQLRDLKRRAAKVIPGRVQYFAPLVGVDYGRISIRSQKTRWENQMGKLQHSRKPQLQLSAAARASRSAGLRRRA